MQHLLRDEWARADPLPRSAAGGLRRAHVAWENARAACARSLALAAGFAALLHSAVSASGGYDRIFAFGRMEQHRYTAMALLTGTLRLRTGLAHARFDEQVHDGAVYTNWGYGVPFLQAPFHALAHALAWPGGFFPDRAIFLLYASGAIALLWAGFDRMLSTGGIVPVAGRRHAVSWAATLLVLCCALYPLTSCRFLVYEETIAYFVLAQLAALGAYLFGRPAWRSGAVAAVALAAGIGVLIRPTGLVYSAVWCALVAIGSRRWRATAVFAGVHAPLLALWAWLNGVRSGHLFALGYANTMPTFDYHTPIERFGSACNATPADALDGALHLLRALFVDVTPSPGGWLSDCHFGFELRGPATEPGAQAALLGPVVLGILVWVVASALKRRGRGATALVPVAGLAVLVAAYAHRGQGLVWRYAGDFWPLVVLACVEHVRGLPESSRRWFGLRFALAMSVAAAVQYWRVVAPSVHTIETLPEADIASMFGDFTNARFGLDPTLPSRFACGDRMRWPVHNGEGWDSSWAPGCGVSTFTNMYLGIPNTGTDEHELRFATQGATEPTLRVYVNGEIYTARLDGDTYVVPLRLSYARFTSPIVLTTIEWTRWLQRPKVKLLSIELR